jgi:lipopolysaccharide biosynthesis glycosyltransferase
MASNLIYQYYLPFTGPDKGVIKEESNGFPFWANLGIASAKNYANDIGVQYELSTEITINAPNQNLEACRIFLDPYFDQFDKVLMLDIDTLVNTKENIFNQKIQDIGMIQDGGPGSPQGFIRNIISQLEAYGEITFKKSKTFPNEKRYLNGGVVLWSKDGRLKARKLWGGMPEIQRYRSTLKMNEQPYLNLMINKHNMDITELSNQWNRMNYMWPFGLPDGKINHFLAKNKTRMKEFV